MDDYSRFTLVSKLRRDMTTDSSIVVVHDALDKTSMARVAVADPMHQLSDNGPDYVARFLSDYLGMLGTRN